MEYKLKYPIVVEAENDKPAYKIEKLVFPDRIKTKFAKLIPNDAFETGAINPAIYADMIGRMAGIERYINELDYFDLVGIVKEVINPFLLELESQNGM